MSWLAREEIDEVILAALGARALGYERAGESVYVVRLVGGDVPFAEVRLVVGDQSLLVESFFVGKPGVDAEQFYRFLLERNGRMHGVHFAIDSRGDVYLLGRLPLLAVTPDEIDRLLNRVLTYLSETFDAALAAGFGDDVRQEWEWRASAARRGNRGDR